MFYDLNVPVASKSLSGTIEMLIRLGYDCIALNQYNKGKVPPDLANASQAVSLSANATAMLQAKGRRFQQLSRLTVLLDDQKDAYHLNGNSPTVKQFDIVAVAPSTDKLFAQCCEKLEVDIISLDLSKRLPFFFKPKQVNCAIERNVYFEISYSAAIADMASRKILISNALQLVRATKQKNIILTSQAERAMLARGPYDVANLGRLFGLSAGAAKQALGSNCRAAVVHGKTRRTVKGVIAVTMTKDLAAMDSWQLQTHETLDEVPAADGHAGSGVHGEDDSDDEGDAGRDQGMDSTADAP